MIHPVAYEPSQDFGDNPTAGLPANHWIIMQFGNYQPDGHTGIDYPCPVGTPVRAAAAGVVLHVGRLSGTYASNPWWISPPFAGFVYVVDHGHFIGIYGHCMDGGAQVVKGQRVKEGQVLGLSGNTGASTGPHLHFEVLPDKYVLNSLHYGRVNPHSLFVGSLTPAGTIKPIQAAPPAVTDPMEEIMGFYRDRADFEGHQLRIAKEAAASAVAAIAPAIAKAVWDYTTLAADGKSKTPIHRALRDPLNGLSAAVAADKGLNPDQLQKIIEDAIAKATITVDVNVSGATK